MKRLLAMAAFAALAATPAAQGQEALSDRGKLIQDADKVVEDMMHDPAFAEAARAIAHAQAVYIVPKLVKAGLVIGGESGDGVLVIHSGKHWNYPTFYSMGSASIGAQVGIEQAELVFIINSRKALDGIQHGHFKMGAGGGITVANLSSGAEGAVTAGGGDVVVWTSGTGAYGGVSFNGTSIDPDEDYNARPAAGVWADQLDGDLSKVAHEGETE